MKFFLFILVIFVFFSCDLDNPVAPNWKGCIQDSHCEDNKKCIAGVCIESEACTQDTDCLPNQYCNESNLCEPLCQSDSDCGVGFICNLETKHCIRDTQVNLCEADSDCETGYVCQNYRCILEGTTCESNADCLNTQHCQEGQCIQNCTETSCPEGYQCNTSTHECERMECQNDADCKAGQVCQNGTCENITTGCQTDSDCPANQICKEEQCVVVQECQQDSDCPELPLPINCIGSWQCLDNTCKPVCDEAVCGNGVCEQELGESPTTCLEDCRDKHCDDGEPAYCDMEPPVCGKSEILAIQNNCYVCVNPQTCKPKGNRCGNGFCEKEYGETPETCSLDCQACETHSDCFDNPWVLNCLGHWECLNHSCTPICDGRYCGDNICQEELGETSRTCLEDCEQQVECTSDEDCASYGDNFICVYSICQESNLPVCGNGECEIGEWDSCPQDCQTGSCGDGYCNEELGEDPYTCPEDCLNQQECRENKDCKNKPWEVDCYGHWSCVNASCVPTCDDTFCGNGVCDIDLGETQVSCSIDCQDAECYSDEDCEGNEVCMDQQCIVPFGYCGDGYCNPQTGETSRTCPQDCAEPECQSDDDCLPYGNNYYCENGACLERTPDCGNGICEIGEWDSCPEDCQPNTCGDGFCDQDLGETEETCPEDCQIHVGCYDDEDCLPYGEQFICRDQQCVEQSEPVCGNGVCEEGEEGWCLIDCNNSGYCGDGICTDAEQDWCVLDCQQNTCGDGVCDPEEIITCPEDCESNTCQGNNDCSDGAMCLLGQCVNFCIPDFVPCPNGYQCINSQCVD